MIDHEPLTLDTDFSYEETPMEILANKQKVLRNKTVNLVKVLWRNQVSEEATWVSSQVSSLVCLGNSLFGDEKSFKDGRL